MRSRVAFPELTPSIQSHFQNQLFSPLLNIPILLPSLSQVYKFPSFSFLSSVLFKDCAFLGFWNIRRVIVLGKKKKWGLFFGRTGLFFFWFSVFCLWIASWGLDQMRNYCRKQKSKLFKHCSQHCSSIVWLLLKHHALMVDGIMFSPRIPWATWHVTVRMETTLFAMLPTSNSSASI